MPLLLTVHLVAAILGPFLVRTLGRKAFGLLALAPASAAIWALALTSRAHSENPPVETIRWVPAIDLEITFRLDSLSWFLVLIVGAVGALVLLYCAWYFAPKASATPRFAGVFVAFAGAMLGLVSTDNTLMLYLFWELTTVFSYLLIGHYYERKVSRRAAMQAIIVTTAGGLVMLGGLILLGQADGGSYSLHELATNPPAATTLTNVAIICVLIGAMSKSALIPLHFWLPAAMAAPTPVSAYLHAAAMVKAGVYLVARLAPGYADRAAWEWPLLILASATMLLGGYRALRQWDLKLVLAYGTVSQLGLLMMLVGQADRAVALAGLAMVGGHAMFKAAMFLTVGIVDAAAGTRDIHQLSGLRRSMPFLAVVAALATASMIGLPPTAGYVAKEAALEGLWHSVETGDGAASSLPLLAVVVLGSVLTVAYGLRFWWGAFGVKQDLADTEVDREARPIFIAPTALAIAGLAAGLVPTLGEELLAPYADTYPEGEAGHLVLWGGFGVPLLLTVVILGAGWLVFQFLGRDSALQAHRSLGLDAEQTYRTSMRRLDLLAGWVTSLTQRGSIPIYLTIIFLVTVLAGTTAMATSGASLGPVRAWDMPAQLAVAVVIAVSAFLAARSRRRLKAVLLLGISGYGMALLYELHGAPDLALTQLLVETITLVVFVLVLRRLPAYFSDRPLAGSRWLRAAVGIAVGATVSLLALMMTSARVATPVSVDFPREAYEFGYGKNIVNVTLVDIRAWDTMGELSVLLVAATGIASLVFLRVRTGRVERAADVSESRLGGVWGGQEQSVALLRLQASGAARTAGSAGPGPQEGTDEQRSRAMRNQRWLPAGATLAPQRRSVILEIATRLLFHTMVLFSLFLLFSGHNAPGGGFAGGLVAGIALVLRYLAGGRYELGEAAPVNAGVLLGSGLFLSVGAGMVPLLFGGTMLQSFVLEFNAGPFGDIKFVSTLFFDIGVYVLVIGLVLDVLRTLGAELDRQGEAEGTTPPDVAHDDPEAQGDDHHPLIAHTLPGIPTTDDADSRGEEDR